MKKRKSLGALLLCMLVLVAIRLFYSEQAKNIFQWDALGYYMYLPAHYIYHDVEYLSWWKDVAAKYHFDGNFYQASLQPNGKYVFFYSIGTSLLQTPFFFAGHWLAGLAGYPQDGFSPPYQIAVCIGMLIYAFAGLIILRKVLLHYFEDGVVAWVLFLVTLATNYPQYTAVEAGMTHGYLFTLYCLILYLTIQWHNSPKLLIAAAIGFITGLATVVRPTEAVMVFIPLLWHTQTKELRNEKWTFVKKHPVHLFSAIAGGFIALLPQLIYWKEVTGYWIHKMGSKWDFLDPHWRVLFGWEKGWFIYTPVTILMVAGLFMLKRSESRRATITYFLLNVWIIIAWHDWRYGGSYSCRALMQSLAVMAIPLCSLIERIQETRWRIVFAVAAVYLCTVNLFQVWQYNKTIIHYDDMNRKYYAAIYLNAHPSPVEMSLLDTDECPDTTGFNLLRTIRVDSIYQLNGVIDSIAYVIDERVSTLADSDSTRDIWLKISTSVKSQWGAFGSFVVAELYTDTTVKKRAIRMQNAICDIPGWNPIGFYFKIPATLKNSSLKIYFLSRTHQKVNLKDFYMEIYPE